MSTWMVTVDGALSDDERRKLVFDGKIVVFRKVPAMLELVDWTRALARRVFAPWEPIAAHQVPDSTDYLRRAEEVLRTYSHSDEAKALHRAALAGCGLDVAGSAWVRATMRIQPPHGLHADRLTVGLGPHRDSWYCKLFAQNNWWAPICELAPERTLVIYPEYWDRVIPNQTDGWDLHAFRAARQRVTEEGGDLERLRSAYRSPLPTVPIVSTSPLPVLVEPGDVICFSCAHLHEGVPNRSDQTRLSTDFRTVHVDDIRTGAGAPNIDTGSLWDSLDDFRMIESGSRVPVAA